MNRIKNSIILSILILFLLFVTLIPVPCMFHGATGIFCPACGMTRAFHAILEFHFLEAFRQNILSIPLFLFFIFLIIKLCYEIITNQFTFIPNLLHFFQKYAAIILLVLLLSCVVNNLK